MAERSFTDPLLGVCEFQFFYVTNDLYGGYSAKCEKGNLSVDYADPVEVIDLAENAEMMVNLAGGAWKEIGRKGYGELVTHVEAVRLLGELAQKRGVPLHRPLVMRGLV
jgi:hypothetical protein